MQSRSEEINHASQRIRNETEEETESRREDARQRVLKIVHNETEGETSKKRRFKTWSIA